jgi:archaemetzincin
VDISTTKNGIKDWGIMGLGYRPGKSCVVSDFRMAVKNRNQQFYKVVLHELGHTEGLPHCKTKTCLMRDAEGGNHLDEEKDFCKNCKDFLLNKGWQLI